MLLLMVPIHFGMAVVYRLACCAPTNDALADPEVSTCKHALQTLKDRPACVHQLVLVKLALGCCQLLRKPFAVGLMTRADTVEVLMLSVEFTTSLLLSMKLQSMFLLLCDLHGYEALDFLVMFVKLILQVNHLQSEACVAPT